MPRGLRHRRLFTLPLENNAKYNNQMLRACMASN